MAENKNLPGAGDRALDTNDTRHQEQAYGLVMAIVPVTFVVLLVVLVAMHH